MTDREIIKALEYCANSKDCDKCPAIGKTRRCVNNLPIMFALIKRQQAEIERLKAADDQPVKHGHWIVTEYYNPSEFGEEKAYTFKCSECGNAYHSTMGMSYCMDCGAKMDGEEVQK